MPSFGELIATSISYDSPRQQPINARSCGRAIDQCSSVCRPPSLDTPLIAVKPQTRSYRRTRQSTSHRQPAPRKVPERRLPRLPESVLHKPLPLPPSSGSIEDSDNCSIPELSNSLDGSSFASSRRTSNESFSFLDQAKFDVDHFLNSRRSSAESFSYLDRASSEIDLFLTTLKSLPSDDQDAGSDMHRDGGGHECLPLPGMWKDDPVEPLRIAHPTSNHQYTLKGFHSNSASPVPLDFDRSNAQCEQGFDKYPIAETIQCQLSDMIAKWQGSGCYIDTATAVHELSAGSDEPNNAMKQAKTPYIMDQVSTQIVPNYNSDALQHKGAIKHGRTASAPPAHLISVVSPLERSASLLTYNESCISHSGELVELPGDAWQLPIELDCDQEHQCNAHTPERPLQNTSNVVVAELPGDEKLQSVSSLEAMVRRNDTITSHPGSKLQDRSSVYESRRISRSLDVVYESTPSTMAKPAHSEGDLMASRTTQRRPWKGKGKVPPIDTHMSTGFPPQVYVGASCGAFNDSMNNHETAVSSRLINKPRTTGSSTVASAQSQTSSTGDQESSAQINTTADCAKTALWSVNHAYQLITEADLTRRSRIEGMSKKVIENDARLFAEFAKTKQQFHVESLRIASRLEEQKEKDKQEKEAQLAAAALKLQEELDLQERLEKEARIAEERARIRIECVVCGDEQGLDDFLNRSPTSKCQHENKVCTTCLDSWISSSLKGNGVDNIKCPECPEKMVHEDVQQVASLLVFEEYDKAATLLVLSSHPEFAWCLAPQCGNGQLNVANNNYMECVSCNYKQCLKHKEAWHSGLSCEQYDERTANNKSADEAKTLAMIDTVSKPCPGKECGLRIQKIDGCDHITCRKCKHEFCWQCLASHKEIKRIGNTAHAANCKFHSANLDVTWPFNRH